MEQRSKELKSDPAAKDLYTRWEKSELRALCNQMKCERLQRGQMSMDQPRRDKAYRLRCTRHRLGSD